MTKQFKKMVSNLDKYQRAVVMYEQPVSSYLSVEAGAGSGKSTTMVALAQKHIEQGVKPKNILMTTFSKNSVIDLQHKYKKMFPHQINQPNISTLHGMALNILKEHFPEYNGFKIKNSGYGALADVLKELGFLEPDVITTEKHGSFIMQILEHIEAYQTFNLSSPNELDHNIDIFDYVRKPSNLFKLDEFYEIMEAYSDYKIENKIITFSDMLYLAYWELKENPDVLAKVRSMFSLIVTDESQDMDTVQFDFIEQLVDESDCRLVAVYDYLQTIYKFRYATPERLKLWSQGLTKTSRFKGGSVTLPLLMNYRSDANIVKANNYLRRYSGLLESVPAKDTVGKSAIEFKTCYLNILEGNEILNIVEDLTKNQGYEYSDIAIIVRTNKFLKEIIEPAIIKADVPYQTINDSTGAKLLDRELSDYLFNALSLYKDNQDKASLMAIITLLFLDTEKQAVEEFADFLQKNRAINTKELLSSKECPTGNPIIYKVAGELFISITEGLDGDPKMSGVLSYFDSALLEVIKDYNLDTYIRKDSLRVRNSIINMVTQLAHTKKIGDLNTLIDIMLEVTENYDKEVKDNVLRVGSIHCLSYATKVKVREIQKNKARLDNLEQVITLGKLHQLMSGGREYEIETPDGWVKVKEFIPKGSAETYNHFIGSKCVTSTVNHKYQTRDGMKPIKEIDIGSEILTECGWEVYKGSEYFIDQDVCDIEVNHENHRFYADGVVVSNSTKGMEFPVTISAGFTSAKEIKDHDGDLTEKFYVQASRAIDKSIFISSLSYQSFGDESKALEDTYTTNAKPLEIFRDYSRNAKLLGLCRTSGIK